MSDVFISYARSNEEQAKRVEEALRATGHEVWRDAELPAHRTYAEVIEERLKSAKAVVVLWSADAVKSQWVRAEADAARELGTLVQGGVDGTLPPIPFNQIQCADLSGWNGESSHAGWRKLEASVQALAGKSVQVRVAAKPRRSGKSICVLPFANMSGDPEQEYFSDGISEDITTDLSKVSALEVIARNTAFQFKGRSVDVGEIARKLDVTHVLEGSVRKAGNRVRITAQLIDGASGGHIWAERYDRDLTDIFAIQDELSKAIVEALRVRLLPKEQEALGDRCTCNADAYNLFLMARQYWINGDFGDPRREQRVIRLCERAVQIDPNYAQAWALMGLAQASLFYGFTGAETEENGAAAAERALKIDDSIAEAHLPIAWCLAEQGRHDEAEAEIATALRLGPESWEVNKETARLFYRRRRLEDATSHLERAVQIMEADFHGLGMLLACYNAQGNRDGMRRTAQRIVEQVEKVLPRDPENGSALIFGALAFVLLGQRERAHEWIERALLLDPDNWMMRYNLSWGLYQILEDRGAAIAMLETVLANGGRNIIRLADNDPNIRGLRDDPEVQSMLTSAKKRVGLTDPAAIPKPRAPATEARSRS